jgi:hypothetical protein
VKAEIVEPEETVVTGQRFGKKRSRANEYNATIEQLGLKVFSMRYQPQQ